MGKSRQRLTTCSYLLKTKSKLFGKVFNQTIGIEIFRCSYSCAARRALDEKDTKITVRDRVLLHFEPCR
nr:MAG TPA: hypothetical protein [Caudoviricetes sp.]